MPDSSAITDVYVDGKRAEKNNPDGTPDEWKIYSPTQIEIIVELSNNDRVTLIESAKLTPVDLNYQWSGTQLGIKRSDEQNFVYTDLKGEPGPEGPEGPPGEDAVFPVATVGEGVTEFDLSNISGNNYNVETPSAATTFTAINPVVNGFARTLIKCQSQPTVTGGQLIKGAAFIPDVTMEMIVESYNGVNVRYFFLEI